MENVGCYKNKSRLQYQKGELELRANQFSIKIGVVVFNVIITTEKI